MTRRDGRVSNATAGVSDKATGRPMDPRMHIRIAGVTKSFTSTVVLQLAAEHRLSLDDTVEKWLPGLVRGNGNDGSKARTCRSGRGSRLLHHHQGRMRHPDRDALRARVEGAVAGSG